MRQVRSFDERVKAGKFGSTAGKVSQDRSAVMIYWRLIELVNSDFIDKYLKCRLESDTI